jgi:ABC transport system ATP-binding/permease protein
MAAPLLILRDVHLTFGGPVLLDGAELAVGEGERLCLVGRNGSGKSTLLKIAAGIIQPDKGERALQQGTSVRYLPQEPDMAGFETTFAYVEAGLGSHDEPYRARYLLSQFGFTGEENPATLSGGEARRCALARALAPSPDILMLDEPTNHLDLPAIEWLEAELQSMRSAMVLISHDRRFLSNLSRTTAWLDRGQIRRLDRGFADFEAWRDDMLEQEELQRHKLDRKIAREEDWVRYGVSGRRKRNQKRLALLGEMRKDRREYRGATGNVVMAAAEAETAARLIVEAKNISKSYGERSIVKDVSLRIARGDRIGIVGPNGAGKTTLLNMLVGTLPPDKGTVKLAANIAMVTLDQKRESLDPTATLQEVLTQGQGDMVTVGDSRKHVVGYMKDFLFGAEQAGTPVARLSGGERGRLMLARALARPSNLLVLDEPTNDLDLETLDLLQEMLADYSGTVLLVSHDRDFLDRVATSVIAYEDDGKWMNYAGGYSDMVAQRGHGVKARASDTKPVPKASKTPKPDGAERPAARKKMGFKEKHALETLPKKLEGLRAEVQRLQAVLADASLFARDPAAFKRTLADLEAAQAALSAGEDQWLELEMLREELES